MYANAEWDQNVTVIQRAFAKGVVAEPYFNYDFARTYPHSQLMPLATAVQVAENASRHPTFLVATAEARCREEAAKRVRTVAKIAEEEGWFRH